MSPKTKKASCNKKANCTRRHYRRKAKGAARKGGSWWRPSSAPKAVSSEHPMTAVIKSLLSDGFAKEEADINKNASDNIALAGQTSETELKNLEDMKRQMKKDNLAQIQRIKAESKQKLDDLKAGRQQILDEQVPMIVDQILDIIKKYREQLNALSTQGQKVSSSSQTDDGDDDESLVRPSSVVTIDEDLD